MIPPPLVQQTSNFNHQTKSPMGKPIPPLDAQVYFEPPNSYPQLEWAYWECRRSFSYKYSKRNISLLTKVKQPTLLGAHKITSIKRMVFQILYIFVLKKHPCFTNTKILNNMFGDECLSSNDNDTTPYHKSSMGRTCINSFIGYQVQEILCVMLVESCLDHILLDLKTCGVMQDQV